MNAEPAAQRRRAIIDLLCTLWNEGRTTGLADAAASIDRADDDAQVTVADHERLATLAERVEDLARMPVGPPVALLPDPDLTRAADHGPPWRARVTTDIVRHGVIVEAARVWPNDDGRVDCLAAFEPNRAHGPAWPLVKTIDERAAYAADDNVRGIVLPGDLGHAILDALAAHYGGTTDARTTRRDYEHARTQHEQTVGALATIAGRLVDVIEATAGRAAEPSPVGYVRANPPRPTDTTDVRR